MKTYLITDSNTGYTKIGRSTIPFKRERTLQSEKPTIELLAICEKNIEKYLHRNYSSRRIRGEWFDLSDEDVSRIIKVYKFTRIRD